MQNKVRQAIYSSVLTQKNKIWSGPVLTPLRRPKSARQKHAGQINKQMKRKDYNFSILFRSLGHQLYVKEVYPMVLRDGMSTPPNESMAQIQTINCLEAVRHYSPVTKFLFASTSEVVGNSAAFIQDENTILTPRSPYAVSKAAGEYFVKVYRDSFGIFCCFTRCYNHEHSLRGKEFVTRKITDWIGRSWNKVNNNIENIIGQNTYITTEESFKLA